MNFISSYISKKFSGLFKKQYGASYTRDPISDWQHLLMATLLVVICIVLLEGYFFLRINRGDVFKDDSINELAVPVLNRTDLDKVNNYYDAREKKINSLKTTPPSSIDPAPHNDIVAKPSP